MMTSYIRPGGLKFDLPDEFVAMVREYLRTFPKRLKDCEDILTDNPIWKDRTIGVGKLTSEQALSLGVTGPILRASGVQFDIRKARPYCGYEAYDFDVPVDSAGDSYARYMVRGTEMRESARIIDQALSRLPSGAWITNDRKVAFPPREELATSMESLIHHFKLATEGYRVPPGEVYVCTESPRGELGYYIVADGSAKPFRCHVRAPSFANMQAMATAAEGGYIADLVAVIASFDPILGDVDR
jgi:NADH-quinone oxidoreductase subunit D